MANRSDVSVEEWRGLCLDALKENQDTQYSSFIGDVWRMAGERGFTTSFNQRRQIDTSMPAQIEEIVQAELWALVVQGVVVPGPKPKDNTTYFSNGWPFFHVSKHGERVLIETEPVPHDVSGYLAKIKAEIPDLDGITYFYLVEAIECFRVVRYPAVAVMAGVAAENALLQLAEALMHWLPANKASEIRNLMDGSKTRKLAARVKAELEGRKARGNEIGRLLDARAFEVESLIRDTRNEAGHPTGVEIDRDDAFVMLRLLPRQLKLMRELAKWLRSQPAGGAP